MLAIESDGGVSHRRPSLHRDDERLELVPVRGLALTFSAASCRSRVSMRDTMEVLRPGHVQDLAARPPRPRRAPTCAAPGRDHPALDAAGAAVGERISACIHRSTPGDRTFASAPTTVGSGPRACAAGGSRSSPRPSCAPPARSSLPADVAGLREREAPCGSRRGGSRPSIAAADDLEQAVRPAGGTGSGTPPSRRDRCAAATAATCSASAAFAVNGFSHSTCLPASSAAIVHLPWSPLGSGL